MENEAKAVLLARVPDVGGGAELAKRMTRLQMYARENGLTVVKDISGFEDCPLHESGLFKEALNFIDVQPEKITVVSYNDYFGGDSEIYERYKKLLEQQKVQFENYAHPCFPEPSDDQIKIWRYLTLPKFIDLLHSKTLFFTRADFLRADDKSEGASLTNAGRAAVKVLEEMAAKNVELPPSTLNGLTVNQMVEMLTKSDQAHEEMLKRHFVNCWHMNEHENFAMWKVYSEPFGVCVQSTYESLINCFNDNEYGFYRKANKVYIGEVKYVDWDSYVIPRDNGFWPLMHKKREFGYERELRCIVWDFKKSVVKVGVDLERLVHKVYINPYTPPWFHQVISSLCTKYGLGEERIIQSSLM
ncbi:hypothetical protein CIW54_01460 [Paraburkholderia sp. T12-10]|nr:hypothetical protein CIW54_01460 [Paraburkholderia sp. T12-10]